MAEETYKISCGCSNCGFPNKVDIPKETLIRNCDSEITCSYCECKFIVKHVFTSWCQK